MSRPKRRILYLCAQYPLLCETYIQTEIDALSEEFEVHVLSSSVEKGAESYHENAAPYTVIRGGQDALRAAKEFAPHCLHMHWMMDAAPLMWLAKELNVPYTVRAHSFDTLYAPYMKKWMQMAQTLLPKMGEDERFLGVLAFPFSRAFLECSGIHPHQIHDCFPVVNTERFLDKSDNGEGVMNLGACLPKKNFSEFLEIAARTPELDFDLYAVGHEVEALRKENESKGSPVRLQTPVVHSKMPGVFKSHRWLLYTADRELKNVGWPVAIAEAQASGCGVLMANVRPDLKEYVGDGGYLFDSMEEAIDIVKGPVPEAMRNAGFEQAKKSDIHAHKHLLTRLWRQA